MINEPTMDVHRKVMVFAEQRGGEIHPISFEILGKGREIADKLGAELSSVILGDQISRKTAMELIYYGADKVFLYSHPIFKVPDVIQYKHNITRLVEEEKPEIFLFGATHFGRSLGPRVAAAIKTGLTADCIDLKIDENGDLIQIRPAFTGNILAHIKTKTRPIMSTVRYKVMQMNERNIMRKGVIIEKNAEVSGLASPIFVGKEKGTGLNIADAKIIVSGGRGLGRPEGFKLVKELADLLGGKVGSSRTPVDEGWIGKEHQVGFSGNTVKPKLYIACGISGSPQHLAGMRDSEIIIAINTDPSAPIFKYADYAIVGDLYQVLPQIIKELKTRKVNLN
ncbi:MAG: electron transfer flavoprotein subunit alpha/FixB family protein [Nitrososphaeria archaeon]|jgi:electron transfer flavoprotein alpha subunit